MKIALDNTDWMQYHANYSNTTQKPNLKETEMKTETTMAKIIAEIRTVACIDDVDAEAIEKIVQDELNEYCRMLDSYYWEEHYNKYCNGISSVRDDAYDEGHSDGYDDGYENGYADCNAQKSY